MRRRAGSISRPAGVERFALSYYSRPTPNAQRPTPNAQRPTPNAQRPTLRFSPPDLVLRGQLIRLAWSPGPGCVRRHLIRRVVLPVTSERIDDAPRRLHLVAASEERSLLDHTV